MNPLLTAIQYRLQFKKMRVLLAWIGALILFLSSRPSDQSFRLGIPFVILGETIRLWASGYIEIKGKKLAMDGPFAYLRNPLYLGNFLIGLGIVLISGNLFFFLLFIAGFFVLYRGTIGKEEQELREKFGESYINYSKEVPRFFPRWTRYPSRDRFSFQWKLLLKHREYIAPAALAIFVTGIYLWKQIVMERQFGMKEEIAIAVVISLTCALAAEWIFRKIEKRKN